MAFKKVTTEEKAQIPQNVQPSTAQSLYEELKQDVVRIYEESITIPEAERLAAKFLHAQIVISEEIKANDLDARMKKNGRKTLESQVLLDEIAKHEKKPTESVLNATVQTNQQVAAAQNAEDRAFTETEGLKRLYDIFRDGHIFCRSVAKGSYDG